MVVSDMTATQIRKCHERLERFLVDLLEPVGRSERRHWGAVYVRGLLLDGERKSVEPMASRLPDGNVQAMQQFVGQSPWDWHPIWERLGRRMTAELEPESAWVIDDMGFPKQGDHSVGVERQYSGTLGKTGNCQVAVSLHHVGTQGSAALNWRLYLPETWAGDPERRAEAGIPEEVVHGVCFFLLDVSLWRKAARFHANGVWGSSGGRGGGGECGAAAVGSQTARPTQQVAAHAGKQEAVSGDPAGGFQHGQGAVDEVGRGNRLGQRGQRGAQRFGLCAKPANPELAALVGHRGRRGCGGALQCLPAEQTGDEKQRDHRQAAAQVGQDELGQQGHGALAGPAQVAAHADDAIEGRIDERARVEAMRGKWMFGMALRTVAGTVTIGVSQLLGILLYRTGDGCRICIGSASGSCELPRFVLRAGEPVVTRAHGSAQGKSSTRTPHCGHSTRRGR